MNKNSRTTGNEALAYQREKPQKTMRWECCKWKLKMRKWGLTIITWTISSPAMITTASSATNFTALAKSTAGNDGLIWKKSKKG